MVNKAILFVACAAAVGASISACSSSPTSIPASVSRQATAIPSNVHCEAQGDSVTVTGRIWGFTNAQSNVTVEATAYDSQGLKIGQRVGPPQILRDKTRPFRLTFDTSGTPTRCSVTGTTHFVISTGVS